ncbi:hypothetical protein HK099_005618, partial [Clydaea vesicula]
LISNGSDALDKIRFLAITDKEALKHEPELKITIIADKGRKTLTITDTGVGMTKEDLKNNLGVIAKSGTSEFLSSLANDTNPDMGLIGQFGVGFYSVFLVADSVTVISKHNAEDAQHIWESTSEQDFTISVDPRGNTLGRGTQIIIHLKEDATEYLEESTLKALVKKYSEFINFPIYLWTTKTTSEEVPDDSEIDEPLENDDDVEDVDESEKKPKTKTVTTTTEDWEKMNENKPIWNRPAKEITEQEYKEFYQIFAKDTTDPASWIHFKAEGEVDFRGLLFIPAKAPPNFLQKADDVAKNIKLFVRKVFITDELLDFLPRYLSFLKGLIDSDDLPLNVSRETLQHSAMLKLIKKKVIGKAMEMLKKLSKDDDKWESFIKEYGTALKLGIIEDTSNRKKLSKLIRFHTSHVEENGESKMTSLDDYVSRMKKGQPQIYVCTGADLDEIKRSPFTEKLLGRGYEVLYLPDAIDEYVVQSLNEYDGKKLQSIAKAGLKYGDEESTESKNTKEAQAEQFKPLTEFLQTTLSAYVDKVTISNLLTKSPCAIIASEHGITGTMEKLMQNQALGSGDDFMRNYYLKQKKIFEINPDHPVILGLLEKVLNGEEDKVKQITQVLYEATLLRSGYQVSNTMDFAKRIEKVIRQFIGVDLEKEVDESKLKIKKAEEELPEVKKEKVKKLEEEEVIDEEEKKEEFHDEL